MNKIITKIKSIFNKKKEKPSIKSVWDIQNKIEVALAKNAIDIKTSLTYKLLHIFITHASIFESLTDLQTYFKEKNIPLELDIKESEDLVQTIVKYRMIKEFLAISGKDLSIAEQEVLAATLAKQAGINLEKGGITNNTTMVLGAKYLDSIDMVKNLISELDDTAKALELGAYENISLSTKDKID